MRRTRERTASLAALAGGAMFAGCLGTVAVAGVALHLDHVTSAPLWQLVVAAAPVAVLAAGAAAFFAMRFGRALRLLRADAVRRLRDPSAPVGGVDRSAVPDWTGSELADLARTLEALHLRVRMADEVAERHRRTAETASAGMFELLAGLVEAEEGARGQLSAELHDTVAQSLMAARNLLADSAPEAAAELVAEAEEQVRAVMARTRPPALRDGDLARAVAGLRDDMSNRYGLVVDIDWPQQPYPLPLVTAVTVYRFFQEGLVNVVKHADVDRASVSLRVDEDRVVAVVRDDGPGFDPDSVQSDRGRHVGLGLLRERARLVGGSLTVESTPTAGTTLTLQLPRGAANAASLVPAARPSVA